MWGNSRPASIDPNKLNKLRIAQTLDRHCSLFVNGNQCLVLYALAQWTTGNSNNNNNSVWWWRHDLKIGRHGYAISSCPLWCCITYTLYILSPARLDGFVMALNEPWNDKQMNVIHCCPLQMLFLPRRYAMHTKDMLCFACENRTEASSAKTSNPYNKSIMDNIQMCHLLRLIHVLFSHFTVVDGQSARLPTMCRISHGVKNGLLPRIAECHFKRLLHLYMAKCNQENHLDDGNVEKFIFLLFFFLTRHRQKVVCRHKPLILWLVTT